MAFFHRYRSPRMPVVLRQHGETGILVAREIEVEIDFACEAVDARGMIVPEEALGRLDDEMRGLFEGKLLIDNDDPHADDLMKLKRIGAAEPVLFERGTTGPALSFYVGEWALRWLAAEPWMPGGDNPLKPEIALATVRLGRSEFFYDLGG